MGGGYWRFNACLAVLLTAILQSCASSPSAEDAVEALVKKRALRDDGYQSFELAHTHIELENEERISPSHFIVRRDAEIRGPVKLRLETGASVVLDLRHRRSVLNERALVQFRTKAGKHERWRGGKRDCYFTGHLQGNSSLVASFSFCSKMMGTFTDGVRSYWVESLDGMDGDNYDGRTPERVLVAGRDHSPDLHDPIDTLNVTNLHARERRSPRFKRQTGLSYTVEIAVVTDALYTAALKAAGHETRDQMVEVMTMKWNGVQAEWGKADVLLADVLLDIKRMDFWETDVTGYTASSTLETTLDTFCTYVNIPNFDHIHLFTGVSNPSYSGLAILDKICVQESNCAVSTGTGAAEYKIAAHELGHQFNMGHDSDLGCTGSDVGIMGSRTWGWSSCSVSSFVMKVMSSGTVDCLSVVNVPTADENVAVTLSEAWPGMLYTDDEMCEFSTGPGYRYRPYPYVEWGECSLSSCTNMDTSSPDYGLSVSIAKPVDGRWCADGMVCRSTSPYSCISWADTGIDPAPTAADVVVGGWGAWGASTACSRTCGTGVQYRQRVCNNPTPQYSGPCSGQEYEASTCNTQPCSGDSDSSMINIRASETCAHLKQTSMYEKMGLSSSDFQPTGSRFYSQLHGQCEVKCDTSTTTPTNQRFGLMPDGTPCNADPSASFVEANQLARFSGRVGRCLQGYCQTFDCTGSNGDSVRDSCGVCDGDDSTCTIVEGTYTTAVTTYQRVLLTTIPGESFLIQAWFQYSSMKLYFLELRSKEGTAIIATMVNGVSRLTSANHENPTYFAGTHWFYHPTSQYLYAEGPTDQAVDLKLYNYGSNAIDVVNYAYSRPPTACTALTCDNGGTWNLTTCTCDCTSGFYGQTCTDTCGKYCKNGMGLTAGACTCDCTGNTFLSGGVCECRNPFTGPSCQTCKITACQNGGTFDSATCRCTCPDGYGDLDCSSTCQDASGDTATCAIKHANGDCDSDNVIMERDCYKTCGYCVAATSTSSTQTPATTTSTTASTTTTTTATTTTTTATTATTASTAATTTQAPTAAPTTTTQGATTDSGAGSLVSWMTHVTTTVAVCLYFAACIR